MPSEGLDQRQRISSEEIERYRRKLLDLSKRNNLISFRHQNRSARQLRAVDDYLDDLFEKLEADGLIVWDGKSDKGRLAPHFNSTMFGFALFQLAGGQNYANDNEAMRWVDAAQFVIERLVTEKIIW